MQRVSVLPLYIQGVVMTNLWELLEDITVCYTVNHDVTRGLGTT